MKEFFSRWLKSTTRIPDAGRTTPAAAATPAQRVDTSDPADTAKRLAQAGDIKGAISLLAPMATDPGASARTLVILGNSYLLNGQTEQAIATLERARALQPSNPAIALNLANALRDSGEVTHAETVLQALIERNQLTAEALDLLGILRLDSDDPEGAIHLFDRALAQAPHHTKARFNRACALLTVGRSAEAWPDYELRAAASHRTGRPIINTAWHGESAPNKSMFVYAEQGIGEEILFASCFGAAASRVKRCTIECSTKLYRLFSDSYPQIEFLARDWHNDRELPAESASTDIVIAGGSLLRWLRPDPANGPPIPPYLVARLASTQSWRKQLAAHGPGPYIGLCWRGGTRFTRQRFRSLAPSELAPLFEALPQATFVSLLHTATTQELDELRTLSRGRFLHFSEPLVDMADTAALLTALDLTISVPTTVVYLASALRTPVWACTTRGAGWKWGYSGDQSPWLPGAHLFRQRAHFDWSEVITRVAAELPRWQRDKQ